jgi:hypothetical protein
MCVSNQPATSHNSPPDNLRPNHFFLAACLRSRSGRCAVRFFAASSEAFLGRADLSSGVRIAADFLPPAGTVFEITPGGALTTVYSFSLGGRDGFDPPWANSSHGWEFIWSKLLGRGRRPRHGVKITLSGTLTTLHSFDRSDGLGPQAGLIQATDGNFYGGN